MALPPSNGPRGPGRGRRPKYGAAPDHCPVGRFPAAGQARALSHRAVYTGPTPSERCPPRDTHRGQTIVGSPVSDSSCATLWAWSTCPEVAGGERLAGQRDQVTGADCRGGRVHRILRRRSAWLNGAVDRGMVGRDPAGHQGAHDRSDRDDGRRIARYCAPGRPVPGHARRRQARAGVAPADLLLLPGYHRHRMVPATLHNIEIRCNVGEGVFPRGDVPRRFRIHAGV